MADLLQGMLSHSLLDHVALVLVHTTWQATIILVLALAFGQLFSDVYSRYAIGVGSLTALGLAPVLTGCLLTPASQPWAIVSLASLAETAQHYLFAPMNSPPQSTGRRC